MYQHIYCQIFYRFLFKVITISYMNYYFFNMLCVLNFSRSRFFTFSRFFYSIVLGLNLNFISLRGQYLKPTLPTIRLSLIKPTCSNLLSTLFSLLSPRTKYLYLGIVFFSLELFKSFELKSSVKVLLYL